MESNKQKKLLFWMGTARKDIRAFPKDVRCVFAYGLYLAERGGKHPDAKPLRGFGGSGVLEIVEDHDGSTFRAVYTIKLADAVYVLHAFQKKSKKRIATPKADLDLIKVRLKQAREHHTAWSKQREREG